MFSEIRDPPGILELACLGDPLPKDAIEGLPSLLQRHEDHRGDGHEKSEDRQVGGHQTVSASSPVFECNTDLPEDSGGHRRSEPIPKLSGLSVIDDDRPEHHGAPDRETRNRGVRVRLGDQDEAHAGSGYGPDQHGEIRKSCAPLPAAETDQAL